ncbi:MAG: hypothetical protein ACK4TI_01015 [Nitrososphaerales archaeon]
MGAPSLSLLINLNNNSGRNTFYKTIEAKTYYYENTIGCTLLKTTPIKIGLEQTVSEPTNACNKPVINLFEERFSTED